MTRIYAFSFCAAKIKNILKALLSHDLASVKIPTVTAAELCYGALKSAKYKENIRQVKEFLSAFEIVPFDFNDAVRYGEIRAALEKRGCCIGPNDLLIAASALSRNAVLVTNNTREFSRIEGLILEDWTKT